METAPDLLVHVSIRDDSCGAFRVRAQKFLGHVLATKQDRRDGQAMVKTIESRKGWNYRPEQAFGSCHCDLHE
jgi:hypothetical protein